MWTLVLARKATGSSLLKLSPRHLAGDCRLPRAYGVVGAHIAPGKLIAATPTAFHPRPGGRPRLTFGLVTIVRVAKTIPRWPAKHDAVRLELCVRLGRPEC
jgi:hypothetical protein